MIQRLQGWQSHYGATHRKNFDTPPLKGWCVELLQFTVVNMKWLHGLRTISSPR
jgi:hypothetical protein